MSIKSRIRDWIFKDSAVAGLVSMGRVGQAQWTDRKYKNFADEGYKKNIIVFKCMNEVMNGIGQVPWVVYKVQRNGDKIEAPESELAKLLRRPNPKQGQSAFFSELTGYHRLAGDGYVEVVKGSRGLPRELYAHRPDRMAVIPGETELRGYKYTVNGVSKEFVGDEKDLIWHFKTFNPLDDWNGMSPVEAAAYDIDIHTATLQWNKALLDNRAQPSGAMSYQPKTGSAYLPDEEYTRLQQELDNHTGKAGGNGRPMLLEGGLEWVPMSHSPAEMDYLNCKDSTARDICMAFAVPPMLLGIPGDTTYNNMAEARLSLWENNILPWAYTIRDDFNAWLSPMFGDEYRIDIDEDKISALAPRRESIWGKMETADWISPDEKRTATGYEERGGPADELYGSAGKAPLGSEPKTPGPVTPSKSTNFPSPGENQEILLKNSAFPEFNYSYALNIKENHPDIWALDSSIRGDHLFEIWKSESPEGVKEREQWAQRNSMKSSIRDIVSQMKRGVINTRGESWMKSEIEKVINERRG